MSKQQEIIVIQDPEYEVQQILNRKCTKSGVMYLIKWKNYSKEEATWQPVNNLCNSLDIVKEYEKNRKKETTSNQNSNILNFDEQSEEPKPKKKAFDSTRIFPRPLKKQTVKQQLSRSPTQKKILKKQKKLKKLKQKQEQEKDSQVEDNFFVVISQSEQSGQQIQEPKVRKIKVAKDDIHSQRIPSSSQDNASSSRIDLEFSQPSINLSELEDEENQRFTLQNLNPDIYIPSRISPSMRKKLVRIDKPLAEIKTLKPDDPRLKSKELKIEKIVKIENNWLALISLNKETLGYVAAQTLQKKNCKLMLDYLFELLQQ